MTDHIRLIPITPTVVESVHPALRAALDWASDHEPDELMQALAAFCAGWDARGREEADDDAADR